MKPSDRDETLAWKDRVKLTIPGGALKAAQKMSIFPVQNFPKSQIKALEQSAVENQRGNRDSVCTVAEETYTCENCLS